MATPNEDIAGEVPVSLPSPSVLNMLLSNAVDNRVGRLLRLKRMAEYYPDLVGRGRHLRTTSTASDRTDGSVTPPPSYHEDDSIPSPSRPSTPRIRPASADCARLLAQPSTFPDRSGVKWQWANQGYSMLLQAMPDDQPSMQDPYLTRALYLSSLDYFLQGLPSDLNEAEAARLRRSLPSAITRPATKRPRRDTQLGRSLIDEDDNGQSTPVEPSRLRRSIANLTFYFMLLVSIILPYIQLLLRQAYEFDRRHKLSERALVRSIVTLDSMSRHALEIANHVCEMNDGKVGETLQSWSMWCVEGVSGGFYDGVSEGMQTLGINRESVRPKARPNVVSR